MNVNCTSRGVQNVISYQFHVQSRLLGTVYTDTVSFASSSVSMTEATSTLSRINLKNATFAAKTFKMFSVHINRFQTVSLSTLKRCLSPRRLARQSHSWSHMAVVTSAFSKSSVFAVDTNTLSQRFQINLSTLESVFKKFCFRTPKTPF